MMSHLREHMLLYVHKYTVNAINDITPMRTVPSQQQAVRAAAGRSRTAVNVPASPGIGLSNYWNIPCSLEDQDVDKVDEHVEQ